jgi:hypothetical protein
VLSLGGAFRSSNKPIFVVPIPMKSAWVEPFDSASVVTVDFSCCYDLVRPRSDPRVPIGFSRPKCSALYRRSLVRVFVKG